MKTFVNLTPHSITLSQPGLENIVIPASGQVARVSTIETEAYTVYGFPVMKRQNGKVEIPDLRESEQIADADPGQMRYSLLIVSSMALEAAIQQKHPLLPWLVAPDSGPTAIRENGQIKAVTRLICS